MVNFHDPVVMWQDAREYTFPAILYYVHQEAYRILFDSGGPQAVAHCVRNLHVSLSASLDFHA